MTDWSEQTMPPEAAGLVVKAYVDGSCLNNGSPDAVAAVGGVIQSDEGEDAIEIHRQADLDTRATSNLAEYFAVLAALDRIQDEHSTEAVVSVYSDSELIVRQLQGSYRVGDRLEEIHRETRERLDEFRDWRIKQRSESDASEIERADELAKEAARGGSQ